MMWEKWWQQRDKEREERLKNARSGSNSTLQILQVVSPSPAPPPSI